MGRIRNSWNLVKQSFAILRSDTVLMLYPVLSAIACVLATAFVVAGGGIVAFPAIRAATQANVHWQPTPLFSVVPDFCV